ncbi:hypothetical protein C8J56DRAFT_963472 [Mycena floridula]|nr:hypothetical protein C8J56DRAFT_963472 [Mycena floridula]
MRAAREDFSANKIPLLLHPRDPASQSFGFRMSQSWQVYYFLDDTSPDVTHDGAGEVDLGGAYFGGSALDYRSYQAKFHGTSILVVGTDEQTAPKVTIDNKTSEGVIPTGSSYAKWFQSPLLAEGTHTLNLTNDITDSYTTSVDFMAVTPGNSTKLDGRTLMVDDTYLGIDYDFSWSANNDTLDTSQTAFQGTTHLASNPGSKFNFSYTGTNMTLYGLFQWYKAGSFDISVTLDDQPSVLQAFNSTLDPNPNRFGVQSHFPLFATGDLDAGNHTISVNLTRCDNQVLIVDFIMYNPSFSTLADMPNLTVTAISSTSTSTSNPFRSHGNASIAAIVGGVVGGLALIALLGLLFIWRRRRQRSAPRVEPFPVNSYSFRPASPTETFFGPLTSSSMTSPIQIETKSEPNLVGSTLPTSTTAAPEYMTTDEDPSLREERLRRQIQVLKEELDAISRPPDYDSNLQGGPALSPVSFGQPLASPRMPKC